MWQGKPPPLTSSGRGSYPFTSEYGARPPHFYKTAWMRCLWMSPVLPHVDRVTEASNLREVIACRWFEWNTQPQRSKIVCVCEMFFCYSTFGVHILFSQVTRAGLSCPQHQRRLFSGFSGTGELIDPYGCLFRVNVSFTLASLPFAKMMMVNI